jgi:hypothetical protein
VPCRGSQEPSTRSGTVKEVRVFGRWRRCECSERIARGQVGPSVQSVW